MIEDLKKWHDISNKLSDYLLICSCQRKLKSIVIVLVNIHTKIKDRWTSPFTSEEYLICALLDRIGLLTHGINVEYPILNNNEFWDWIIKIKDDVNLTDN